MDTPDTTQDSITGSCLCHRVRLSISALARDVVYCHCSQCRKQSGHYFAATSAADHALQIDGAEHLVWYAASDDAKRGFCGHCGSVLMWKANGSDKTSILAGCLDNAELLKSEAHIHVADKGDYYELVDGLPQYPQSDQGP